MNQRKNLIGQRFGRFKVVKFSHHANAHTFWTIRCDDCHETIVRETSNILRGRVACDCKGMPQMRRDNERPARPKPKEELLARMFARAWRVS